MRLTITHPALRWWAPVAVVVVVAGTALVARTAAASAGAGSLPPVTVDQLISDVQHANVAGVSGTVVESADLGLPSLPNLGSGTSQLTDLLTGTHTLRVWYGGRDQQRVALLSSGGESDIIHSGQDVWLWDSNDNSATHFALPTRAPSGATADTPSSMVAGSPVAAATSALGMLGTDTTVSVTRDATVARHRAYELVLTPKQPGSLIAAVRIAVDGTTHVPLRVQVDSVKTGAPALSIGFTTVDFGAPDPAEFAFTPPPGATVKQGSADSLLGGTGGPDGSGPLGGLPQLAQLSRPTVVGSGWASVAVAKPATGTAASGMAPPDATAPMSPRVSGGPGSLAGIVAALPQVSGSWGTGRVLEGTLFTAVFTSDGTVAIGATTPELVYQALGAK